MPIQVPLKCNANQWIPISGGRSLQYKISPTLISELGLTGNVSTRIRVTNGAGLRSTSQSEVLELQLANSTRLDSFEVEEFLAIADDSVPVSNGPCILNRTHSLRVRWLTSVYFQSIVVTVIANQSTIAVATLNGSAHDVLFATLPGLSATGSVHISITTTALHGGLDEYHMKCLVDTEPPVAGSVHLSGAFKPLSRPHGSLSNAKSSDTLYIVKLPATPLTVCWEGFEGAGSSGIREYLVMICRPARTGNCLAFRLTHDSLCPLPLLHPACIFTAASDLTRPQIVLCVPLRRRG